MNIKTGTLTSIKKEGYYRVKINKIEYLCYYWKQYDNLEIITEYKNFGGVV